MKRALGVCYYPEHWDESRWPEDAARMAELGLSWVRIGEFAWSRLEPAPGRLDWDWLDRAMGKLGAARLQAVPGTPTATPPPRPPRLGLPRPGHGNAGRRRPQGRAGHPYRDPAPLAREPDARHAPRG